MIQQWDRFIQQPEIRAHAVFLSDYDMQLAERLVQGVDLWINNPVMPHEASGMKVLVNGGLNLSVLDGWWAEAYNPNLDWALGDGKEYADDRQRGACEVEMLYNLLEYEIIPEFYDRDDEKLPVKWLKRVKESMSNLTPRFSATRTVMEYTEQHYLSAAEAYFKRSENNCAVGKQIHDWQKSLMEKWSHVRFADFTCRKDADQYVFEAKIDINGLDPESVRVELYADHVNGFERVSTPMRRNKKQKSTAEITSYCVTVPAQRPPTDFTPRIVPFNVNAHAPLEASYILWPK
jgi:starch phosphorylase